MRCLFSFDDMRKQAKADAEQLVADHSPKAEKPSAVKVAAQQSADERRSNPKRRGGLFVLF